MEQTVLSFRGLFGVPVEVRQSVAILVLMMTGFALMQGGSLVITAIFLGILLISVYLHELGHAWGARVQGITVSRIVLHGGGGFCEHRRSTLKQDELIVAMGPLVNLSLWAVLGLAQQAVYQLAISDPAWAPFGIATVPWLGLAGTMNLFLFFYNMVPVLPLDGGRLLQIGLRRFWPPAQAIRIAGAIGVVFCILWFPMLIWVFLSTGWLLFFIPSLALHLAMARGEAHY